MSVAVAGSGGRTVTDDHAMPSAPRLSTTPAAIRTRVDTVGTASPARSADDVTNDKGGANTPPLTNSHWGGKAPVLRGDSRASRAP